MNHIHHSQIKIAENRIRRTFNSDRLRDLAGSIESKGLLHPVVLRHDSGLNAVLVAGERRFRAMQILAEENRPFKVVGQDAVHTVPPGHIPYNMLSDLSEDDILEAELEENSIRVDLDWTEHAAAIGRLHKLRQAQDPEWSLKKTNEEISDDSGPIKDQPHYDDTRRMVILADNLTDDLVRTAKDPGTAMKLLRKRSSEELASTFADYLETKGELADDSSPQIFNEDGIQHMLAHPDTYEVIIADPPYGIDAQSFNNFNAGIYHEYEDSAEAYVALMDEFSKASFSCTKEDAHLYCFLDIRHWKFLSTVFAERGWTVWPWPIIWGKRGHGLVPSAENGPSRAYELILFARKGNMKVTAVRPDLVMYPVATEKIHAAQKPIALIKDLLSRSCDLSLGTVLDPFCGSGTTIMACRQLGLDVVGCEIDEVMYNRALINLVTNPDQEEETE